MACETLSRFSDETNDVLTDVGSDASSIDYQKDILDNDGQLEVGNGYLTDDLEPDAEELFFYRVV